MLQISDRQAYQKLFKLILTLRQQIEPPDPDLAVVQQSFEEIEAFFREQILPLTHEETDLDLAARWQSFQTEIHRSLRLLATDILFLRSSKQSTTAKNRLKGVNDRLDRLMDYCKMMDIEV